jgi:hypothetical protein
MPVPVVFVVHVVRDVLEVLHVRLDEEAAEEGKVGMLRVVHLDKAPRVLAAAYLLAVHLEKLFYIFSFANG